MRTVGAIIILEGLDATGKSTLAEWLYRKLPAPVALLHAGPPRATTAIREYVMPLGIAGDGYVVVCDRWHLGERVWPDIFDRDSLMPTAESLQDVEERMRYLSAPILPLYMNRPLPEIVAELDARNESAGKMNEANWAYAKAMTDSLFNWQNTDLEHGFDLITRWLDGVR